MESLCGENTGRTALTSALIRPIPAPSYPLAQEIQAGHSFGDRSTEFCGAGRQQRVTIESHNIRI